MQLASLRKTPFRRFGLATSIDSGHTTVWWWEGSKPRSIYKASKLHPLAHWLPGLLTMKSLIQPQNLSSKSAGLGCQR